MPASKSSHAKFPLATIAAYGRDNSRATKLGVGILCRAGQEDPNPVRTWSTDAGDARNDPVIAAAFSRRAEELARLAAAADFDSDTLPAELSRPPAKTGRNEPCPCASEKKYKKCRGR